LRTTRGLQELGTVANHRDDPLGPRKAFKTLLALSIGFTVSIVLPNLRGEPPTGSRQNEELKDSKVQIRFPKNASSGIIDGKLNADVERASSGKTSNSIVGSIPVTQASSEQTNQQVAEDWKDPLFVFFVTGNQTG